MNRAIRTSVRLFAEAFSPAGPVVELGSHYRPEDAALADLRPFFPGLEYLGCDIRPGHGVDRLEDAHALRFADRTAGTVLMLETLEHLHAPHRAVAEARRVLRDDGRLVVSVPFDYRLHGFPSDYWRFTASGVHVLLAEFADDIIFALGPRVKPAFIFGVAAKAPSETFTSQKEAFRVLVERTFRQSRFAGTVSVLKRRGREFFGFLLGRADLSVRFFDPLQPGGYLAEAGHGPGRASSSPDYS